MKFDKKKVLAVLGLLAALIAGAIQLVNKVPDAVEPDAGAPAVVVPAADAGVQ